jgi:hypothetical protein
MPYNLPPPNTADPNVDPNLANPTGNDDDDAFFEPSQGEDDEHPEDALELDSQNDSNQSKTLSGTKELKENPPEDEASSAKKARKGDTSGTPLNE